MSVDRNWEVRVYRNTNPELFYFNDFFKAVAETYRQCTEVSEPLPREITVTHLRTNKTYTFHNRMGFWMMMKVFAEIKEDYVE